PRSWSTTCARAASRPTPSAPATSRGCVSARSPGAPRPTPPRPASSPPVMRRCCRRADLPMTVFDYVFLGLLAFSALIGMWRGLVSEVMAVLAWAAALFAAWRYNGEAAEVFTGMIVEPMWRQVAGGALVVVGVLILAALLRYLLRELLRAAGLGATDRFFGALFGIARGLAVAFVVVLIGGLAGVSLEPRLTQVLLSPPMDSAVISSKPRPLPDVAHKTNIRM